MFSALPYAAATEALERLIANPALGSYRDSLSHENPHSNAPDGVTRNTIGRTGMKLRPGLRMAHRQTSPISARLQYHSSRISPPISARRTPISISNSGNCRPAVASDDHAPGRSLQGCPPQFAQATHDCTRGDSRAGGTWSMTNAPTSRLPGRKSEPRHRTEEGYASGCLERCDRSRPISLLHAGS